MKIKLTDCEVDLTEVYEEYLIKRLKYENSFIRRLFNFNIIPFELESFDNYLFENYRFIWDLL